MSTNNRAARAAELKDIAAALQQVDVLATLNESVAALRAELVEFSDRLTVVESALDEYDVQINATLAAPPPVRDEA